MRGKLYEQVLIDLLITLMDVHESQLAGEVIKKLYEREVNWETVIIYQSKEWVPSKPRI